MSVITSLKKPSLAILGCAVTMLSACAAPSSYMGIALNLGATDAVLQQQARLAVNGDKQAQLDLGIRFEEGLGVERDLSKAKQLYRQAASDSGGTVWVYSPPVGNGTSGRVIPVNSGVRKRGIAEAIRRLDAIK